MSQTQLFPQLGQGSKASEKLRRQIRDFGDFGRPSAVTTTSAAGLPVVVETFTNEFWTAKQRAASSLHEVSYRACFKPQLPRFFIERLTRPGDVVHDPYMGRGTTVLEATLLGRRGAGSDVNPLSRILLEPRLAPPTLEAIQERLESLDLSRTTSPPPELLVFFHEETLAEIGALREHLLERERVGSLDAVDRWIRMVAINRLTGHSPGFFSVYTLPPNQAVSVESQRRINERRSQTPPRRDVRAIIEKKCRTLLADVGAPARRMLGKHPRAPLMTAPAAATPELETGSVALVVTSPPFLDVVDYAGDNWLRCWFAGIDPASVALSQLRALGEWADAQTATMTELARVLRPGGHVAFEVGEVRGGKVRLEETVIACGVRAGLTPILVLRNDQTFTKTAHCWGVDNGTKGTNSNRVVVLER